MSSPSFSGLENNGETRLKANVNVVSLKVGSLVDVGKGVLNNLLTA